MPRFNAEREIAALQRRLEQELLDVYRKLTEHKDYHRANESRWGIQTAMSRHPVRTLVAGVALGLALAYGFNVKLAHLVEVVRGLF